MTTLSMALAILPFILLGSIAGQEMAHPMAIVILGGLVTSTLLNLFLLPPLYLRFGHEREREHELFSNPVASEA
jgi:Cu/Ag efflux pump CusA